MALTLDKFAFGLDSGTESTHPWIPAGTNAHYTGAPLDTNLLLRINVQESDVTAVANLACTWQYSRNGGAWTNITTTSTVARAVPVAVFANGANCTQRLAGTGSFETSGAGCTEDGTSGGSANDLLRAGCTEQELGFQLRSADLVAGDYIDFRVIGSTAITVNAANTPRAYIAKAVGLINIATASVLLACAVTVGAVTLAPPALTSTVDVRDAHVLTGPVNQALSLDTILGGASLTVPTVSPSQALSPPTISAWSALTAPIVHRLVLELYEGTTLRATRDWPLTSTLTTQAFTLTTDERTAITNWATLRLSCVADGVQVEVSQVYVELPEGLAAGGLTQDDTISTGAVLSAPVVAPGAVTLLAPTIPTGLTLLEPRLGGILDGATVAAGSALYAPTVAGAAVTLVLGDTIAAGSTVAAPTLEGCTVSLLQGSTLIASTDLTLGASLATFAWTLTTDQRNAVTDWTALRVSVVASGRQVEVSQLYAELPASSGNDLSLPTIGSGLVLNEPALDVLVLEPPTIDSGSVVYEPALTVPVILARLYEGTTLIVQVEVPVPDVFTTAEFLFDDNELAGVSDWSDLRLELVIEDEVGRVSWAELETPAADAVQPPTIAAGSALTAPVLTPAAATLILPFRASSAALTAPALTTGAVPLYLSTIGTGAALAAPSLAVAGASLDLTDTIATAATLAAPTVASGATTLTGTTIITGIGLAYPPALDVGAVTLDGATLDTGAALLAPVVTVASASLVLTETMASGAALTAPSMAAPLETLQAPTLASTAALSAPTLNVSPVFLVGAFLPDATQVSAPSLTLALVRLTVPVLDASPTVYAPAVIAGQLVDGAPALAGTVLYAPVVSFMFTGVVSTRRTYTPDPDARTFTPDPEVRVWIAT
jgi:hypothetical protein